MLTHLQIRDLAIVESVEIETPGGFTVLTGETGAGKSILIDALLLISGARADSGSVRHGTERAEITATFDVARNAAARAWLDEQSIAHEGECVVRRIVTADGRGRAYVNGQTVPAQTLRSLAESLVDIHGQLEFQSLVRKAEQRTLLDASGGLGQSTARVATAFADWRRIDSERETFDARTRDRDSRLELLTHYVAELEALDPKDGEVDALQIERRRSAALGRLAEGTGQASQLLGTDGEGAMAAIARAQSLLRSLLALDPALAATERSLDEASIACREAMSGLSRYLDTLEADPSRQNWLESRLAALENVARKHHVEPARLPRLRDELSLELGELRNLEQSRADLDRRLNAASEAYRRVAEKLSGERRRSAVDLDRKVTALMQELGMPGGVFETRVTSRVSDAYSPAGSDDVEFLVSANPGQPPRPLAKVASGGELSRISLALQVATLSAAHLPCLVFDEVDAGVGGAVAEQVGRMLAELAGSAQVLCVTHLPQVASQAAHQVRVEKHTSGGHTRTSLTLLTTEQRVEEIARMLGGSKITARTREHAREMLEAVRSPVRPASRKPPTSAPSPGAGSSRARSARAKSASGR